MRARPSGNCGGSAGTTSNIRQFLRTSVPTYVKANVFCHLAQEKPSLKLSLTESEVNTFCIDLNQMGSLRPPNRTHVGEDHCVGRDTHFPPRWRPPHHSRRDSPRHRALGPVQTGRSPPACRPGPAGTPAGPGRAAHVDRGSRPVGRGAAGGTGPVPSPIPTARGPAGLPRDARRSTAVGDGAGEAGGRGRRGGPPIRVRRDPAWLAPNRSGAGSGNPIPPTVAQSQPRRRRALTVNRSSRYRASAATRMCLASS
jgi:hypothetical protein